jgi:DNA repair protein RadA/Sms
MTKSRVLYVCQQCGHESPKWQGRCPGCEAWNSFLETVPVADKPARPERSLGSNAPLPMSAIQPLAEPRIPTGFAEVDRVLGGGLVVGSVVLFGGDPGIGKSTLLLQVADRIARGRAPGGGGAAVPYVTAEESAHQTKLRASRLGAVSDRLLLFAETRLDDIAREIERLKPAVAVVDSIQLVYRSDVPSAPGTVSQVRECATQLVYLAKRTGTAILLVGHVTKEGTLAGPRTLEHLVDAVFYFEGDRYQAFRVLRAVKNRFGSTFEIGIFEMRDGGLAEVPNPSAMFLSRDRETLVGTAVVPSVVGSRTLLLEIQALSARANYGTPVRRVSGADFNRVAMILAVLERRCGLHLGMQDVYVSVVGGVTVEEPAADLGIAMAVASGYRNTPLPADLVVIGELGLAGEVRPVAQASARLAEARRMGFTRALVPSESIRGLPALDGLQVRGVSRVTEALAEIRSDREVRPVGDPAALNPS